MKEQLKIGIILGSTRQGRVSPQVGEWVKRMAEKRNDAHYEVIDIAEYKLPFAGEARPDDAGVKSWSEKIDEMDGYVFIVAEYNHSLTGVLKNALDSAYKEWNNKAAGIVSYGSTGGARAAEHLRGILGELSVADVRVHPTLSIFTDFEQFHTFKPAELHATTVNDMLDQVTAWSGALRILR
ncbi:NADPH-dependent FMN reductase [Paenibacillus nasutitermitis]|uniref:FMN reductase n=1 Tax=Paenibacillus nasutitermitis TaxID=1652958 RepID=A0A916YN21_9BACL|nr:NAD(P)H-dependent oxidoreductase [Paenibacillus nasutitermitis]GGD52921.1 FMN reductase [Paenibacillus nasutitermitis]